VFKIHASPNEPFATAGFSPPIIKTLLSGSSTVQGISRAGGEIPLILIWDAFGLAINTLSEETVYNVSKPAQ
jgi:hypothetical protein